MKLYAISHALPQARYQRCPQCDTLFPYQMLNPISRPIANAAMQKYLKTSIKSDMKPAMPALTLTAHESYGIDAGQPVVLHGMQIGQVVNRQLHEQGVSFTVAISPDYRNLVHDDSKFIINNRLDVKFGIDGMEVIGASAREWVDGGIRLDHGSKSTAKNVYPLYANAEKAAEGITTNQLPPDAHGTEPA